MYGKYNAPEFGFYTGRFTGLLAHISCNVDSPPRLQRPNDVYVCHLTQAQPNHGMANKPTICVASL